VKEKTNKSLLESLVSQQGEIFEKYLRTNDRESLYNELREFSQEILDKYGKLPQNDRGAIDAIYHHIYGMEKLLESKSEDIS